MKKSSHHKIGGCSGTRYGCCPNSNVSKVNHNGTNCHNHNRRPDSRIQYIGYHPRQFYPIIRQPTGSNQSDNSELFHIFNLILVLIVLMFSILMAVRFLK
jgi:hypothetical protein